jgi:NAD(P)-dependent dehydrogenase (short-subunit alcohol dehydrogenase family)
VSADLTRSEPAMAMVKEVEARLGAIDVLVNSAGAAKRYLPERPQRDRLARSHGREVLQYDPCDRCRAAGMVARGKAS